MILSVNLADNLLASLIGAIVMGVIGLVTYIFHSNRDENKQRIDARAAENDKTNDELKALKERVVAVEVKVEGLEKHYEKLEELIKSNHKDLTGRLDSFFQKITVK